MWLPTPMGVASFTLGINLVATQKDSEEDSFGNDYDKDLAYPVMDAAAINDILKSDEGGSLTLGGSVKTDDYLKIKGDVDVTLGGNTWTVGDNTKVVDGADLKVTGGTITFDGEDPAQSAIRYGQAQAVAHALLPQLGQVFRIRRQAVSLECAFTDGLLRVTCYLQVRLLVLDVLALALRYGLRAYRIYRSQTAPESSAADGGEAEA